MKANIINVTRHDETKAEVSGNLACIGRHNSGLTNGTKAARRIKLHLSKLINVNLDVTVFRIMRDHVKPSI